MTRRSNGVDTICPHLLTGHDPRFGVWWLETLTGREKEVLLLLGTGLGNRELARQLGIAERTVKAHIANIVEKIGQTTRTQAAIVSALAHDALCSDPSCARHPVPVPGQRRPAAA
ncbi:helix-turn-helix transcriptional regulator [Streptomyces pluripotens]|uniref:Helix-turn-helix transcriptional regulator n=2 Tax=Streptomyces pluripotens TaxID=1355015 RepID=A0A221NZE1_9ACTN|nr:MULTISPECIES: helix-turn-helix transcriptional regulator [Streptomyces]ARP71020.1 helix-turn-helix transcriptional regulator [Streptomyces pluripotens]ASN25272.1 helix-turn-helix transcriptional regulator [Streptomyces pluripotens]MCH0557217.1 helix-turn-helix transcriptional regulator [Streptomyces sp. MUM 16J]